MKLLLIGQTTLHWGRMEFGNIGNYYIIEPFIRELHKTFPEAEISTTFQMSERFINEERIKTLPIDIYYGWNDNDTEIALEELGSAYIYNKTGYLPKSSPFIDEVMTSDIVIDYSGDLWGDNADFLGKDRFFVGLVKDRIAQLLRKRTAMIAGSPGPFNNPNLSSFAKEVFRHFDLVTNRESLSIDILKDSGFEISHTHSLACPSFLFHPADSSKIDKIVNQIGLDRDDKPSFGFVISGWNFLNGPFDKWPRDDEEYTVFAEAVEFITEKIGGRVYLMSHSNGFPIPPAPFELLHGRDYQIIKQLGEVLSNRGISKDFFVIENILDAWQTKAIISRFDILVSGRIHGAVAGLSQNIPTVIIDYGHEPKAHKLRGFAIECGVEKYFSNPAMPYSIIRNIENCWNDKLELQEHLRNRIPKVKDKAIRNFSLLKDLL